MSRVVLNDWNITPKEHAVLLGLATTTFSKPQKGITAQGLANALSGRVGGSVGSTRKALSTMLSMGCVTYFMVGRTKYWHLSQLGTDYIFGSMQSVVKGQVALATNEMFEEIPF